jgi:pimeloyl-ACP methyl ester carboxylesterase
MAWAHAERLRQAGIAVLTYDKRGVGGSTGTWRTESLADYAADALAGLAVLRGLPEVDSTRVGIVAHSQGGWVALQVAARQPVPFLVLVSATPLSPLDQSIYAAAVDLRTRGLSGPSLDSAIQTLAGIYGAYANPEREAEARRAIAAAQRQPWFDPSLFALQPDTAWNRRWLHDLPFAFDVTPHLASYRGAMLTINGSEDPLVPADSSRLLFEQIVSTPRHRHVVVAGNHSLGAGNARQPAAAYWQVLLPWLDSAIQPTHR